MATGRPWGQYFTLPSMTAWATRSSSWGLVFQPPLMAALQAMVWSSSSRAAAGSAPPVVQQLLGNLLQGGGDILHRHVKGGLAHRQVLPQLVHLKAELLQQRPVGQQDLPLLGGQAADGGGQQALGHGVIARRLHPVKVHPLMGGVLVDQNRPCPPAPR